MRFEWDADKARQNKTKHDCSFEQAAGVFADKWELTLFDEDHSASEERWITLGEASPGEILVVVHTFREYNGIEVVRIISARRATRLEEAQYFSRRGQRP